MTRHGSRTSCDVPVFRSRGHHHFRIMGSCIGKCWCYCFDCGCLASHHPSSSRHQSAAITDMSSSTCMLFDSMHNNSSNSPSHVVNMSGNGGNSNGSRSRSDSAVACIMRSWKRKSSFSSPFSAYGKASQIMPQQQGFQLRSGNNLPLLTRHQDSSTISGIEFETLMCDFDIPVSILG